MSHQRKMDYLLRKNIIWIRKPITDKPDIDNDRYTVYLDGTYECYELFRSKAKITTYKSLKWHLLVLWYLNPQLDQDEFMELATFIADKQNGFIAFAIHAELLRKIVYDVSMYDLNQPPKNKIAPKELINIIAEYSPKKNIANNIDEYSVKYPATRADSSSGKSKYVIGIGVVRFCILSFSWVLEHIQRNF